MRNLDISSNRTAKTRELPRYVPFVEPKSRKRMASRLASTTQCKRETSGSSISMSAPPPSRPIVTSGRDNWHSIPCDEPVRTEILMVVPCGSDRLVVSGFRVPPSLEPLDLSCGELTAIVGGPGPVGTISSSTAQVHIQHLTCEGLWFANCFSSKSSFAPQLGQWIRICH